MSLNQRSTNDLLRRYLNGALTAPEEAELERRARTDEPLSEAMKGLQAHPEADHEARIARMLQGARTQVQGKVEGARVLPLRRNYFRYAAAASVVVLFVSCALWFLPQWFEVAPGEMAMEAPKETSAIEQPTPVTEDPIAVEAEVAPPKPKLPVATPQLDPPEHLRPRPNTQPPPPTKTKREEAGATPDRAQSAQPTRAGSPTKDDAAVAIGQEAGKQYEETAATAEEEMAAREAAAPPPAPLAPAPITTPTPSVAASQPTERFEESVDMADIAEDDSQSEGGKLEGRITNENGVPILNALVRLPGQPIGERTDSSGYFRLPADATTTRIEVSHPDYENETIDFRGFQESLQVSLDRKEWQPDNSSRINQNGASSVIILDNKPGYAAPLEGYGALRKRIEAGRPADVSEGKVKFSFIVNTDGTLTDFEFRGRPTRATMDYIGQTLVQTSVWEVVQGEEPVRVYMKVVF